MIEWWPFCFFFPLLQLYTVHCTLYTVHCYILYFGRKNVKWSQIIDCVFCVILLECFYLFLRYLKCCLQWVFSAQNSPLFECCVTVLCNCVCVVFFALILIFFCVRNNFRIIANLRVFFWWINCKWNLRICKLYNEYPKTFKVNCFMNLVICC